MPLADCTFYTDSVSDAALLERMAKSTGGRYFRAEDGSGLQAVMKQIDALDAVLDTPRMIRIEQL